MASRDRNDQSDSPQEQSRARRGVSRRKLLKAAVTSMPAILTLQSGAALARSSNLISAASYPSKDRRGRTLCLDTESVYPVGNSGRLYDLDEPPRAHVIAINERDYRIEPDEHAPRITEEQICQSGRPGFYRGEYAWDGDGRGADSDEHDDDDDGLYRRRWEQIQVRRGVLVSATALTSFAGSVRVTDL